MFGLGGVGKTSLIHRFLFGKFDSAYTATIEDDYRQVITYNNHIVDVTVLDTAVRYPFFVYSYEVLTKSTCVKNHGIGFG